MSEAGGQPSGVVYLSQAVINHLNNLMLTYNSELSQIAAEISEAASHGDLRENAEFEAAKQREQMKKAQREQLQIVLNSVRPEPEGSEEKRSYTRVGLMTFITLQNMKTSEREQLYMVIDALGDVGEVSFDGKQLSPDKVSDKTPFGATLINKPVDTIVKYGDIQYKIVSIEPIDYEEFFK